MPNAAGGRAARRRANREMIDLLLLLARFSRAEQQRLLFTRWLAGTGRIGEGRPRSALEAEHRVDSAVKTGHA